ncbi:putative DnaJ domain-containing protein [Colletotrichum sublineola]|uniref:Putative DnaJ domain-containing protein n=1 Tax=Colletotrichum sublineola TaxID=1173701 RepID=A0A066XV85_COLSU|nr:putative DnaJ domain-containing protein [Colletotrichum sublineola]
MRPKTGPQFPRLELQHLPLTRRFEHQWLCTSRNTVLLKEKVKHSLRSVSSRFSLNDKFAATRQKNEFGGDDASIIDCMTLADNSTVAANPGAPDPNALDGAERGIKGVVVSKKKFLLVKTGDSEEDTDLQTPTM